MIDGTYQIDVGVRGNRRLTTGIVVKDNVIVDSSPQMTDQIGKPVKNLISICKKHKWNITKYV
jgi:hypothetical protein